MEKDYALSLTLANEFNAYIDAALENDEIDKEDWYELNSIYFTKLYLSKDDPRGQSGHGGDENHYIFAHLPIMEAIYKDGTFCELTIRPLHDTIEEEKKSEWGVRKMEPEVMTLTGLYERFETDKECREYLYAKRWPDGFVCPKCGVKGEPFNVASRRQYQCKQCNHQTSVTAGTVMDKSQTPLKKWFLAIYLMSSDKRGCSAMRLKRELHIAYDTAWTMSHKIRNAMKERDANYQIQGYIELDESFFGRPSEGEGKRGRGTDKAPVIMGLSLDEEGKPKYLKTQVLDHVNGESIVAFAEAAIEQGSTIASDCLPVYRKLSEHGYSHLPAKMDPKENPNHLRWYHVISSNLKAFLNGTYHGVERKHLQAFLDEFCYRFNRRFWPDQLFARTMVACSKAKPFTRHELVG